MKSAEELLSGCVNASRAAQEEGEQIGRESGLYKEQGYLEIDMLISRLGGVTTSSSDCMDYGKEMLVVYSEEDFRIKVPSHHSHVRDRYTKGRALGHYFLHYLPAAGSGDGTGRVFGNYDNDRDRNSEAHAFAYGLLLPRPEFIDVYTRHGDDHKVAKTFQVSLTMVESLARALGLKR